MLTKYTFELLETNLVDFREIDSVISASSLDDAVEKFARKHDLQAPAYWDAPSFEMNIELTFKNKIGDVKYRIHWNK